MRDGIAGAGPGTVAYGDESAQVTATPPAYLLCAAVFSGPLESGMAGLARLKPKGAPKLHWRSLSDSQRSAAVEIVSGMPVSNVVVAASPLDGRRQERARRKCLELLLVHLEGRGIGTLVLESRDDVLDKRDRECLMHLRRTGMAGGIDLRHARGADEPRLWVPDQVLGAYAENARGLGKAGAYAESWARVMERTEVLRVGL